MWLGKAEWWQYFQVWAPGSPTAISASMARWMRSACWRQRAASACCPAASAISADTRKATAQSHVWHVWKKISFSA